MTPTKLELEAKQIKDRYKSQEIAEELELDAKIRKRFPTYKTLREEDHKLGFFHWHNYFDLGYFQENKGQQIQVCLRCGAIQQFINWGEYWKPLGFIDPERETLSVEWEFKE